ncbi:MAG: chemotaxis protein CheX [Pirellulaceae bacterium]
MTSTTADTVQALQSDIEQIVETIFETMLGWQVAPVAGLTTSCGADHLIALVQISGSWSGGVSIDLHPSVARLAAAAMLQTPPNSVTDADLRDVAAELANMIGGNLKSLLPAPSFLSLPSVVAGREFCLHIRHAAPQFDAWFEGEAGLLHVGIFERRDDEIAT